MTIYATVTTALKTALPNTWAGEMPQNPTFPAIVFEIDSNPEDSWVIGGGYDQHSLNIVVMAKTMLEIQNLLPSIDAAVMQITGYMFDGERGDADYEGDASVYAYFINHTIRTPRY